MAQVFDDEAGHHKKTSRKDDLQKADKREKGGQPKDLDKRLLQFKPVIERVETKIANQFYNDFINGFAPYQSASLKIEFSRGLSLASGVPFTCTINNDNVLANNKLGSLVTIQCRSNLKCELYPVSDSSLFITAWQLDHWWNDAETQEVMLQPKKEWETIVENRILDGFKHRKPRLHHYLFTVEKSSFAKIEEVDEAQAQNYVREAKFSKD